MLDVQAAIDEAKKAGKVGIVGYCWGGTVAWVAAARSSGLAARCPTTAAACRTSGREAEGAGDVQLRRAATRSRRPRRRRRCREAIPRCRATSTPAPATASTATSAAPTTPTAPSSRASARPVAVRDAFLQARRERRPVVIGVPFDLQSRPWDGAANLPKPSRELLPRPSPIPPHPDDVAAAAKLLAGAERVVVLAGLGAVEAGAAAACRALAARTGGLLATTLPARGLFHDDPFCVGISGSYTPEVGIRIPCAGRFRAPRSAARSPTTRAAAASSGRRRRCCRSTSTRSRSARDKRWRATTCGPTRDLASRR